MQACPPLHATADILACMWAHVSMRPVLVCATGHARDAAGRGCTPRSLLGLQRAPRVWYEGFGVNIPG
eukprot:366372-Chlamydomonas_euryale.AAC.3